MLYVGGGGGVFYNGSERKRERDPPTRVIE